jgi:hypothetical protein
MHISVRQAYHCAMMSVMAMADADLPPCRYCTDNQR